MVNETNTVPPHSASLDPGRAVPHWTPPEEPRFSSLEGRYVRLERLDPAQHAAQLHAANGQSDAIWDFLPYGPFGSLNAYRDWLSEMAGQSDPRFMAVIGKQSSVAEGVLSYLRITPEAGSIEIGHINFATSLQKTRAASEAILLLIEWAFEAGYRRLEWKCNAQNLASRRAAIRYGLSYEGVFRNAAISKGRNRDTAWFAAICEEWPRLQAAYARWLDAENFTADGRQITPLSELTAPILVARDPLG